MSPLAKLNRFDLVGVIFLIVSLAFCIFGLRQMQSNTEDVLQWLPDQSIARENYNLFREHFGSDDFLIVTWKGCTIQDDRLTYFSRALEEEDTQGLVESVTTGSDVTN